MESIHRQDARRPSWSGRFTTTVKWVRADPGTVRRWQWVFASGIDCPAELEVCESPPWAARRSGACWPPSTRPACLEVQLRPLAAVAVVDGCVWNSGRDEVVTGDEIGAAHHLLPELSEGRPPRPRAESIR